MQLNVHTPVGNSKVALGAIVAYNNTPPDQNLLSVMSTYAYRIYLGSGRLSFGLSAGVYGVNSDYVRHSAEGSRRSRVSF